MPDANITKQALAASLKKNMREKPFDKISVIDICEGCGMNRKSFYYHFKDKYDLVNWIFYTDFVLLAVTKEYNDGWDLILMVAELFDQDRAFYTCALEIEGQNSFRDYFYESTMPIMDMFLKDLGSDPAQVAINKRYMSDAFLAILYRWLKSGEEQTPEKFVANMRLIISNLSARVSGQ
ncbi:MAG: TetR/AcrR family transcriptional regulator C-terminal domain-containing protein [Eubacterium sp.]|nr:TetR/AcrR family transcriptional regulator C-terminal domain-containing protein [Eubacterium sp.]